MNKTNVTNLFKTMWKGVSRNSPEILTGMGIAGMVTTTVLAVKATPKALALIEEEKRRQNYKLCKDALNNNQEHCAQIDRLKPVEIVKVAWKPYIPAAITGVFSIACVVGASSVHTKRNAALATAYQLSTTALNDYRDKVVETIGVEKADEVRDKVVKEKIEKTEIPAPKANVIESFKDVIFHDMAFGQTFYADVETIRKAVNDINSEMLSGQYASLNDFYDALNIDRIEIGESLGWNISRDGQLEVSYDRTSVTKDGRPCYVLEYHKAPEYNYYKL